MLSEELRKKIRLIEISTRKLVDDAMSGQYKSHFKGQGVQFSEHRLYVPGDDVRHIDWKVSARSRDPLVKKYEEERELTVFLVVDVSASESFGSAEKTKSEVTAETAAMLASAAIHSGDRVGVLLFGGEVEKVIPPKKGRQHILRIVKDLLTYRPRTQGTDLAGALDAAGRIMKHSGVIFLISDFMANDYEFALKRLAKRHDVVAITVADERESEIPEIGTLLMMDPETGDERLVDTSSYAFKKWFTQYRNMHEQKTRLALKGARVDELKIVTKEDYGEALVRYFRARSRKRR
ncbi:MAG: DUF58 domain-containing protein [Methylotenera sp.]|nr:DUF58 domain-containing protein [Oligoflexia bacterium]